MTHASAGIIEGMQPRTPALNIERLLLACGVVGPALFVVVFLIAGATRPGYDPVRHPVSSLALGGSGWIQDVNFVVTGVLVLAYACGLRPALRRHGGGIWAPVLIGMVGVGLIGAGVFVGDPVNGYPPGTPNTPVPTTEGILHDAFSVPVFVALPAASVVVGRWLAKKGRKGWTGYCIATAVAFLIGFVLASLGFSQEPTFLPVGGLLQRFALIVGCTWLVALALFLLRSTPARSRAAD